MYVYIYNCYHSCLCTCVYMRFASESLFNRLPAKYAYLRHNYSTLKRGIRIYAAAERFADLHSWA